MHCSPNARVCVLASLMVGAIQGGNSALAQVVPDLTLGAERSEVAPAVFDGVNGGSVNGLEIGGGAQRGPNLFHSFTEFGVRAEKPVYFANPAGVANIFSRVTGDGVSRIDDVLGVSGPASLFLLNPNGIVFGPGARLNIAGSFVASTAAAVEFSDGQVFSAVETGEAPLLNIGVTPGLQYGNLGDASIRSDARLRVRGELELAAGNVELQDTVVTQRDITLIADGDIQTAGLVTGAFSFNDSDVGNITLQAGGNINIAGTLDTISGSNKTGDIFIEAGGNLSTQRIDALSYTGTGGNVNLQASANLITERINTSTSSEVNDAGDIQLKAGGNIDILGMIDAVSDSNKTGDISIEAGGNLLIQRIDAFSDAGVGGDVNLLAEGNLSTGHIDTSTSSQVNNAGDITLSSGGDLDVGELTASSTGNFSDLISNSIFSSSAASLEEIINQSLSNLEIKGNGGDILLNSNGNLNVGNIESAGFKGGNIHVKSSQPIIINDESILSFTTGDQKGGQLQIDSPSLSLLNLARAATVNIGDGKAGNVTVNIPIKLAITNSNEKNEIPDIVNLAFSSFSPSSIVNFFLSNTTGLGSITAFREGDAGDVDVKAGLLEIRNDQPEIDPNKFDTLFNTSLGRTTQATTGIISSTLFLSRANGGSINIEADTVKIKGNQPGQFKPEAFERDFQGQIEQYSQDQIKALSVVRIPTGITAAGQGVGNPGSVSIQARVVDVKNGAGITAGSLAGSPNAERGLLLIDASELIQLEGKAAIAAATIGAGNSNDVQVKVANIGQGIFLSKGAIITADTLSIQPTNTLGIPRSGSAGDLVIETPLLKLAGDSRVGAGSSFRGGQAGSLTVIAGELEVENSLISAETIEGEAGTLTLKIAESALLKGQLKNGRPNEAGGFFAGARGTGDGGELTLSVPVLIVEDGAAILASTQSGRGGNINLRSLETLSVNTGGKISAETRSGQAGFLAINTGETAAQSVQLRGKNSGLFVNATEGGNSGSLSLKSQNLELKNGAEISVSSIQQGGAGDLRIEAEIIDLKNQSLITATTEAGNDINFGNIVLTSLKKLSVEGSAIATATQTGQAGNFSININQTPASSIQLSQNGSLQVQASGNQGQAGNLTLNARNIELQENASILATTTSGSGGNIILSNLDNLVIGTSKISAQTQTGKAGQLTINAGSTARSAAQTIQLIGQGSGLFVNATDGGDAGSLSLITQNLNLSDGAEITVSSTQQGGAGDLRIEAETVNLENRSRITATTQAGNSKNFGNIEFSELEQLSVEESAIATSTQTGQAGNLSINVNQTPAERIRLIGEGGLRVQALGSQGQAGNLNLNALNIDIQENASILATTTSGSGGDINLGNLETLSITSGMVSAQTQTGKAGRLTVNAEGTTAQTVQLIGQDSELSVNATDGGDAGNLSLKAQQLNLDDGAQITVSSVQQGGAGNLSIDAKTVALKNRSRISATTEAGNGEDFGNIELIGLERLSVEDSAIAASTQSSTAGNISVAADQSITLTGDLQFGHPSGIFVSATDEAASGNAGNLTVKTKDLTVQNGAVLSVSSQGLGKGGKLDVVDAREIRLDNQARLTATTASGDGGNIDVEASDAIFMRGNSIIESDASNNGDGGNITLETPVLIGYQDGNSDIIANAQQGNGGNISIDAKNILNFEKRDGQDKIKLRSNTTNDISASSQGGTDGIITLNTPATDPADSLSELPTDVVDGSRIIAQNLCRQGQGSEFIVTGRGGLPQGPQDTLQAPSDWEDWRFPEQLTDVVLNDSELNLGELHPKQTSTPQLIAKTTAPRQKSQPTITEAQGWQKTASGAIQLITAPIQPTAVTQATSSLACRHLKHQLPS